MAVQLSSGAMRQASWLLALLLLAAGGQSVDAGEVRVLARVGDGQPLADAAVVLRALDHSPEMPSGVEAVVDQIDREFVPSAVTVPVNGSVQFPNKDDIRHHVYSFSEARSFELPLYTGTPASPVEFPDAGIVTIACNIHDWMIGYIYVVDSPWHGVTDADGSWFSDTPPEGRYAVEVWHHALADGREVVAEIELTSDAVSRVEATLDISSRPAPRRAPRPGRRGYR